MVENEIIWFSHVQFFQIQIYKHTQYFYLMMQEEMEYAGTRSNTVENGCNIVQWQLVRAVP